MNISEAWGSPMPKTTWVRPSASRHFVQVDASSATSSRGLDTSEDATGRPLLTPGGSSWRRGTRAPMPQTIS